MLSFLRLHEISEARHRILNPITDEKLMLLGSLCGLTEQTRQLDLACGKGEMLSRWAQTYGISGTGVDISDVFLAAAAERATELGIADRIEFVHGDAGAYQAEPGGYDVVSCIGATWIGGGLAGTIKLAKRALQPGGLMLIGEPYWTDEPPARPEALAEYTSLVGTLDRVEAAGMRLVEMVLADGDSWDRYAAAQWMTLSDYLRDHPRDPDTDQVREFLRESRREHLEIRRRYLGWGIFVLRAARAH